MRARSSAGPQSKFLSALALLSVPTTPQRGPEMNTIKVSIAAAVLLAWTTLHLPLAAGPPTTAAPLRAVLLAADQVSEAAMDQAKKDQANAIVIVLEGQSQTAKGVQRAAANRILRSGFKLYYWIEIARSPELADSHPEWMASLQGHTEWRRFFPGFPEPQPDQVVKNFPWVPVGYKESFAAHLKRVAEQLRDMPTATGIFLNDLQGAPSACGCGNSLCRWTADYGPIKTATPYGPRAAAEFVAAVAELNGNSRIIPVWVTECEQHDGTSDGSCAGVGCYQGICWRAYTEQLMPVADQSSMIGVMTPYVDFGRDQPRYGPSAGWVKHALGSFQSMPPQRGGKAVSADRLVAILQGWDVSAAQIQAQISQALAAGAGGYVVARTKIDQDWSPKMFTVPVRPH